MLPNLLDIINYSWAVCLQWGKIIFEKLFFFVFVGEKKYLVKLKYDNQNGSLKKDFIQLCISISGSLHLS